MMLLLLLAFLSSIPAGHCTVIAYDGRSLAADSQTTFGTGKWLHSEKLCRIGQYVVDALATVLT